MTGVVGREEEKRKTKKRQQTRRKGWRESEV